MTMFAESLRAFLKPVLPYLDDDTVTEIMINGPSDVWVERQGVLQRTDAKFTEEALAGAARNVAQFTGRVLSEERPLLDARLPDGSRIHIVLAPVARAGTTMAIRKFFREKMGLETLLKMGAITGPMTRTFEAAVHAKLNVMIAGGSGSGKSTLLTAMSQVIPPEERIVLIEDSGELKLNREHVVPLEGRPPDKNGKGGIDMGDLLNSALRLRPDRIVVGEVRGGECFFLMQALNTGHGGSLATCHANSPTETLRRLESLCLLSSVELPLVAVRAQVASAIQLIVCCERLSDGTRKVMSIAEVLPLNEHGEYRTQDLFVYTAVGRDENGRVYGYHAPIGVVPRFLPKARALGFEDLDEAFFDPSTYGVPPPPQFHAGEEGGVRWVPSLQHRNEGQPDPESFKATWRAWEQKLKAQAAANASTPKLRATTAASAQAPPPARAVARPPPTDPDKTPAPTHRPVFEASKKRTP